MVGLIPKTYILHVLGDTGKRPVTENKEFVELCKKDDIELVSTTESVDLKEIIRQHRPDILLIEEQVFRANLDRDGVVYRSKSCNPYKLVLADGGCDKEKMVDLIRSGADEVVDREIGEEEAFIKIYSILRRKSDLELNQLTGLPSINRTYTVLENCRKNLSDWVAIHLDILHFQSYSLMYGVARSDNAIMESAKVLTDSLDDLAIEEPFVGHLGRDNFLIISNSDNLEPIIDKVKENFKTVLSRLYKQADFDNGYIISSAPNKVRRREGLLELNIGYCTNIDRNFLSGTDIIEQAVKNKNQSESKNKRVLILEDDEDFALLLEETLMREGNEARVSGGIEDLISEVEDYQPRTLILEAAKLGPQNFVPLCEQLERFKEEFGLKILVATNVSGYQNFLDTGADVYVPKPYDLETLLKEVRRLRYAHA